MRASPTRASTATTTEVAGAAKSPRKSRSESPRGRGRTLRATRSVRESSEVVLRKVKSSQVPEPLKAPRRPTSPTRVLDEHDLEYAYSLRRSFVVFCGFLMLTFAGAAVFVQAHAPG